jgi:3-hydroxyacyl-CoA dehydrogenase
MRVGFIRLGMMGKGMAANLQKAGHDLVVHDLSRAAAEPFLAKGAVWANSPKQVAEPGTSRMAAIRAGSRMETQPRPIPSARAANHIVCTAATTEYSITCGMVRRPT